MTETKDAKTRTVRRACNLCEAICGLLLEVEDDRVVSIKGDPDDPFSRGHICPKATALADVHTDPDRLKTPVIREGNEWREVSWAEALSYAAEGLVKTSSQHGPASVGFFFGNPAVHNYGILTHLRTVVSQFKGPNRFSAASVDQMPHQLVTLLMYGHQFLVPIPDIDRAGLFLMMGANPMASNGSLMTVPGFRNRLKKLKARGGKLIVIDPRRTETAQVADEHFFIKPGADAALLMAMLGEIFRTNRDKPGRLAAFLNGYDTVRETLSTFSIEDASRATGIPAAEIQRLTNALIETSPALVYGRMGLSTQPFGALCQWLIQILNIALGALDAPGGIMFTNPAVDMIEGPLGRPGSYGKFRSRVSNIPEFSGELPCSTMIEEMETPGESQVRALVTMAGNPVLSTPNGDRLGRAIEGLEFMVSLDFQINETTRHANVILPPTHALEHTHYDMVFHIFAVSNHAKWSAPSLPKPKDTMHDWEILNALSHEISERTGGRDRRLPPPEKIIEHALRTGPHTIELETLKATPEGIDLGPMKPCLPERLQTPDKRIECAPDVLIADLERAQKELFDATPTEGLMLIGRRHVRDNNSWMHNSSRLVKGKNRCTLMMHPSDLEARGLTDGAPVRVRSKIGAVTVPVEATENVMPGVVSLPHGYGHTDPATRQRIANENAGVSINDLTDPQRVDPVSGNNALNGVAVEVENLR